MHCPQCGQQQPPEETRFCKSCGFSIVAVRTLLATDNVSATLREETQKPRQSPRRKGVRQGVILLFIFMVLMPLIEIKGGSDLQFLPMMFLMAGLMRILYAVIFQEGALGKKQISAPFVASIATEQLGPASRGSELPPARSVPISADKARRVETAEMASPPSVTEHTTKLLNETRNSD